MTTNRSDRVHGFTSAQKLLSYAADNPCDAVFLKIEMRSMNGLDVARELKKIRPNINIIFESAEESYMKHAFELRCSGYLLLPIQNSDIKGELTNLRFSVG